MRVINEDIAGLYLMSCAATDRDENNEFAVKLQQVTALLLDTDHTPKDKEDAAYMIGILLIQ